MCSADASMVLIINECDVGANKESRFIAVCVFIDLSWIVLFPESELSSSVKAQEAKPYSLHSWP